MFQPEYLMQSTMLIHTLPFPKNPLIRIVGLILCGCLQQSDCSKIKQNDTKGMISQIYKMQTL